jgi:hypothetical protein
LEFPAEARFAIYYAPEDGSPLDRFGVSWLGRAVSGDGTDEELGRWPEVVGLTPDETTAALSSVAHYGFHGTLKAPFFLRSPDLGTDLIESLQTFAARQHPFRLPPLGLKRMGRFLALMPEKTSAELNALAEACVREFNLYRRPLSESECTRRRAAGLSVKQERHLLQWGYPYVLDQFRFHLTLAGPLSDERIVTRLEHALAERLSRLNLDAIAVKSISLFIQKNTKSPFYCHSRYSFMPD